MKAITLYQPWATLVAIGAKRYETRRWQVRYRGPLAIHAAKTSPRWAREIATREPFGRLLSDAGFESFGQLARGQVVCVAALIHCHATESLDVDAQQRSLGNFDAGRFAWELGELRRLDQPIAVRGSQWIWNLPPDVARQLTGISSPLLGSK